MPKMKTDYSSNKRDLRVMHTDCKELIDKTSKLTQSYWELLSFADKQQLLYIVRIIEKNNQKLPEYRYQGYECCLNDMLDKNSRICR